MEKHNEQDELVVTSKSKKSKILGIIVLILGIVIPFITYLFTLDRTWFSQGYVMVDIILLILFIGHITVSIIKLLTDSGIEEELVKEKNELIAENDTLLVKNETLKKVAILYKKFVSDFLWLFSESEKEVYKNVIIKTPDKLGPAYYYDRLIKKFDPLEELKELCNSAHDYLSRITDFSFEDVKIEIANKIDGEWKLVTNTTKGSKSFDLKLLFNQKLREAIRDNEDIFIISKVEAIEAELYEKSRYDILDDNLLVQGNLAFVEIDNTFTNEYMLIINTYRNLTDSSIEWVRTVLKFLRQYISVISLKHNYFIIRKKPSRKKSSSIPLTQDNI